MTAGPFLQVSTGAARTCALRSDNATPSCWGVAFPGGGPPVAQMLQIAVGLNHACGIEADGSIACWGSNSAGQTSAPVAGTFVEIAAGNDHTCAIDDAGAVHCWGANGSGQAVAPGGVFGPS